MQGSNRLQVRTSQSFTALDILEFGEDVFPLFCRTSLVNSNIALFFLSHFQLKPATSAFLLNQTIFRWSIAEHGPGTSWPPFYSKFTHWLLQNIASTIFPSYICLKLVHLPVVIIGLWSTMPSTFYIHKKNNFRTFLDVDLPTASCHGSHRHLDLAWSGQRWRQAPTWRWVPWWKLCPPCTAKKRFSASKDGARRWGTSAAMGHGIFLMWVFSSDNLLN